MHVTDGNCHVNEEAAGAVQIYWKRWKTNYEQNRWKKAKSQTRSKAVKHTTTHAVVMLHMTQKHQSMHPAHSTISSEAPYQGMYWFHKTRSDRWHTKLQFLSNQVHDPLCTSECSNTGSYFTSPRWLSLVG